MPSITKFSDRTKWISLFSLWVLHGVAALWHFQVVSFNKSFLPYFAMRVFLLAWIVINIILIIHVYKNIQFWLKWQHILIRLKAKDGLLITASSCLFIRICLWIFQSLLVQPLSQQVGGYLDLLMPVLNLIGYISLETVILIFFINLQENLEYITTFLKFIASAIIVFAILGFITAIVSMTGLGILSGYKGDWQRGLPAVALLEWQILLSCIFCLLMFFLESKKKIVEIPRFDVLICSVIWLGASLLWLSQPVIPNASALKSHEPNFEIYPFNDAQTYDEFAQSVLVGGGFGGNGIPQRPLYVVFLIFSHVLFGQNYKDIIFFQTLVFALFPVLLYLFGREFFSRPIGISIALLAILRDYTSNLVSPFTGNLGYSKVYLSEIPTAMLLILFLLIGIRWIKAGFPLFSGFLLGGIMGSAMLIRTQVIVTLPVIILFALLVQPKKIKSLIKSVLLMVVIVVLVVAPWLLHNWSLTDEFIFDNPESQTINLALRYSRLNGVEPEVLLLSDESTAEYIARLNRIAKDAIASNPLKAAWGISNAFLNHGVNNILLFPVRNDLRNMNELWTPADAFWEEWEGTPNFSQSALIAFYIFVFGLGLTSSWMRNGWLGLLPLFLNLAYNLWTSLALLSGQRFMVTMDWSIYMYYMIGLFTLFGGFFFALDSSRSMIVKWVKVGPRVTTVSVAPVRWYKYLIFGFLFFGVGLSLPVSEKIFPNKYPHLPQKQLVSELVTSPSLNQIDFNPTCFQKMVDSGELSFVQGRAIFPRYYIAGDGERFTDAVGYKVVDEGRLVFNMVGQMTGRFIFKISQQPDFFPHASDVILIYSRNRELWFVYVEKGGENRFYVSDLFIQSMCE